MVVSRKLWRRNGPAKQTTEPIGGEEVARVAYAFFERRGCVHGHDLEDWLRAEAIVRQRRTRRTAS